MRRNKVRVSATSPLKGRLVSVWFVLVLSFQVVTRTAAALDVPDAQSTLDTLVTLDIRVNTPLEGALIEFGRKAGLVVMMNTATVDRYVTREVRGTLRASEALRLLLRDSGLSYSKEGNRIRIVPAVAREHSISDVRTDSLATLNLSDDQIRGAEENGQTGSWPRSLEEVIVTAQKRIERLQDVPISITVLDGQELLKTEPTALVDLGGYVPGLNVFSSGVPGQSQLTLRGIATDTLGLAPLVATYVGETPVGSSSAAVRTSSFTPDLVPYDVERVEVLSGPQGTLYGANAAGGLLKYVFQEPKLDKFEGEAGAIGYYFNQSAGLSGGGRAYVNIPLIENQLAVRISGFEQKTQGFVTNIAIGAEDWNPYKQEGARFAALWRPTSNFSVKLDAILQDIFASGDATGLYDGVTLKPLYGPFETFNYGSETGFYSHTRLYSAVFDWNMGFASLTSASSWQQFRNVQAFDYTPYYLPYIPNATSYPGLRVLSAGNLDLSGKSTEEVRLSSQVGQRFEWMLGGFFTHETSVNHGLVTAVDGSGNLIPDINPLANVDLSPWTYSEIAVFGNGTYKFNDHLELSAGARYAENRQNITYLNYGQFESGSITQPPLTHIRLRTGVPTWMVSPQWHFTKDSMAYLRWATGYRPGGYSGAPPTSTASLIFSPDKLSEYEVGFKTVVWGGRVTLDGALYDIEWKDMQVLLSQPVTAITYNANAGTARSQGVDGSLSYAVTKELRVTGTLSYIDAYLTQTAPSTFQGFSPGYGDAAGARLPYSSKWSASVKVDYQHDFGGSMSFEAGGGFRYATGYWQAVSSEDQAPLVRPAWPLDVYTGFAFRNIAVKLFGKNLTNSQPRLEQFVDPQPYSQVGVTLQQPRTVGLNVDVRF